MPMDSEKECPPKGGEKYFQRAGKKDVQSFPFQMNNYPSRVHRFGKSLKIKRSREIAALLHDGQRYACRYFTIYYLSNGLNRSRYAFITPAAIGSAVSRNKIRRVMRELLRKGLCRGLHLDILFRLNSLTGSISADTLKGVLARWYEILKE
jgi:ribonuclease P protein component